MDNLSRKISPYYNRKAIIDPNEFYGRRNEIKEIYSRLNNNPKLKTIPIVGERRMGKTSLLLYLKNAPKEVKKCHKVEDYVFVYADCMRVLNAPDKKIFEYLLREIPDEKAQMEPGDDSGRESFRNYVKCSEKKIVFLIDEFEGIIMNPNVSREFFDFLQETISDGVTYITSSQDDLQLFAIEKRDEVKKSPFFDKFDPIQLSLFSEGEAMEFIEQPSAAAGVPLIDHKVFILRMAGRFPFFIQVICDHLFKCFSTGDNVRDQIEECRRNAKKGFFDEVKDDFERFWDRISKREGQRQAVLELINSGKVSEANEKHLEDLANRGLLVKQDDTYELFSLAFRGFIKNLEDRFKYFWDRISEREGQRQAVLELINSGKVSEANEKHLEDLANRGLLVKQDDTYELFSLAFRGFIKEKHLG